ncbi:hypothetical protein SKAU_G00348130 [Synaphobranchus kaupii]|uniref:Uncharacterized protein n=1 Tax=Synaphobranchus kaupii TaxID=118154 RepID=A0A9Q1EK44_SYNKA|nr:hypothetical protein SKAU_G00348130 [Synaphobranchus kaupii]
MRVPARCGTAAISQIKGFSLRPGRGLLARISRRPGRAYRGVNGNAQAEITPRGAQGLAAAQSPCSVTGPENHNLPPKKGRQPFLAQCGDRDHAALPEWPGDCTPEAHTRTPCILSPYPANVIFITLR